MRWLIPFLLMGPACSPPASIAKAAAPAPALVEIFNAEQIIRLAAPMDYTPTAQGAETPEANAFLVFRGPDGDSFRAEARRCASHRPAARCEGITLTARVSVPGATPADLLTYANDFNADQAAVYMFEDAGELVLSDDIILDGGISEVNLHASLAAFVTVLRQNRDFLLRAHGSRP